MASGDIKGFYRQRKASGVTKPPSSSSSTKKNKASAKATSVARASTLGSPDPAPPAALVSHGAFDLNGDYSIEEEKLRQFDMDMSYGPCLGMTRLERWERAFHMGLDPPRDVETLLTEGAAASHGKVELDCLWEGHI